MNNHLEQNLISVVVDGCLADKLVPLENTKRMGDWRVEEVKTLTMSLGYQFTGDKRPGNITYNEMMDEIKKHPNKKVYKGILLNPNMLSNNHMFKKFPRTGKEFKYLKKQAQELEQLLRIGLNSTKI